MPSRHLNRLLAALFATLCLISSPAWACSITAAPPLTEFGTHNSSVVSSTGVSTSSTATGIQCVTVLEVVSNSYLALQFENPTLSLKNTDSNDTIPLIISWTPGGAALTGTGRHSEHTSTILGLLKASGGYISLFYRTDTTTPIRAGEYTAELRMRWYYSMCLVGVGTLCVPENSTGLKRGGCVLGICLGAINDWGTGELVTVHLRLKVERDCTILAPSVNFGSHPLPDRFATITQSASVRCSIGDAYNVALDDGKKPAGTTRRMTDGTNFLEYDIFKGTSGTNRWGSIDNERYSSANATTGGGDTGGVTTQTYEYSARIRPNQPAVPAGVYKDTLRLSVIF